jgi:hypothetical protein
MGNYLNILARCLARLVRRVQAERAVARDTADAARGGPAHVPERLSHQLENRQGVLLRAHASLP